MIIELRPGEDLQTLLNKSTNKIIVDVYAKWCGPCKMLASQLEVFANQHSDWTIIRVDSDVHSALAATYHVHAVPSMFIVVDGKVVEQVIGYKPLAEIEAIAKKY